MATLGRIGLLALTVLAALVFAQSAAASTGSIEVVGEHFTFHAKGANLECTPFCVGWYSAAFMAPANHCEAADDPVGTSNGGLDTTPGESELTFSGSVDKAHIGAYEVCLFVYGIAPSRELVATAPYAYPSPSGSIGNVIDLNIPFAAGDELTVNDTVTEPYTGPSEWSWSTALTALPGETSCPSAQPAVQAYGPIARLALTEGQVLHIVPPVASGTMTLCLYIDIYKAPEQGNYLVAQKVYTFPSLPEVSKPSQPGEEPKPAAPKYKALTLGTAGVWAEVAVENRLHYKPTHFRATHCRKRVTGRYRCNTAWRHGAYTFSGWVEVGQVNTQSGRFTYGLRVVRTDTRTHAHHTIVTSY
jgi:hypothetical protein